MHWSRQDTSSTPTDIIQYADVPGGAVIRNIVNGHATLVFVPNVFVYDAGGGTGPFLLDIKKKK